MGSCISKEENQNRGFVAVAPVSSSVSSSSSRQQPAGKPILESAAADDDEQQSSMAPPERRRSSPAVTITRLSEPPVGGGGRRKDGAEAAEFRLPAASAASSENENNGGGENSKRSLQVHNIMGSTRSSFSRDLAAFSSSLAALSSSSPPSPSPSLLGCRHFSATAAAAATPSFRSPIAAQFQIYARSKLRSAVDDDHFSSAAAGSGGAANARSRSLPKRFYGNQVDGDPYGVDDDDYNYEAAAAAFYQKRRSGAVHDGDDDKWGELGLSPRCAAAVPASTAGAIRREQVSAGELRVRSRHAASRRSRHLHHHHHDSSSTRAFAAAASSRNSKQESSPLRRRRRRRHHRDAAGGGNINDDSSRRHPELRIPQEDADFAQKIVAKQQNGPNSRSALKDRPLNWASEDTSKKPIVKAPWKSGKKTAAGVIGEDDDEWCYGRLSMEEPSTAQRSEAAAISDRGTDQDMADFLQSASFISSPKKKEKRAPSILLKEAAMDAFGLAMENETDEEEEDDEAANHNKNNIEKVMELLAVAESTETTEFYDELRMVVGSNPAEEEDDEDDRSERRRYRRNGVFDAAAMAARVNSWPRSMMVHRNVSRSTSDGLMQKTSPHTYDRSNKSNVDVERNLRIRSSDNEHDVEYKPRSAHARHILDDEFTEEGGGCTGTWAGSRLSDWSNRLQESKERRYYGKTTTEKADLDDEDEGADELSAAAASARFVGFMSSSWIWQRGAEKGLVGRRRSDGGESEASFEFHQIRSGASTPSTPIISRASTPRRSC